MKNRTDNNTIVLGMSGGVDSTAAALLLTEKGFVVHGMYFDITGCNEEGRKLAETAFRESGSRGQFHYVDAREEFERIVIRNFIEEYTKGHTPNPCTVCNPTVKFKYLVDIADSIGAKHIATGHYADTVTLDDGNTYIKAMGSTKDQSYMLWRLDQSVISRLIFPLHDMKDKEQVREIARESKLTNAEAKDSQEICFISDDDYVKYISDYAANCKDVKLKEAIEKALNSGNFIDKDAKVLGRHKGILNYTIGQRKGLGIALGKPAFVTGLDAEKNEVVLGDNEDLFTRTVSAGGISFAGRIPKAGDKVQAKIRYAAKRAECKVTTISENEITLEFEEAQRAPTPGQSLVIYDGDILLGGGYIL